MGAIYLFTVKIPNKLEGIFSIFGPLWGSLCPETKVHPSRLGGGVPFDRAHADALLVKFFFAVMYSRPIGKNVINCLFLAQIRTLVWATPNRNFTPKQLDMDPNILWKFQTDYRKIDLSTLLDHRFFFCSEYVIACNDRSL